MATKRTPTRRSRNVTPAETPAETSAERAAELGVEIGEVLDLGGTSVDLFDSMEDDSYVSVLWFNPDTKLYELQGRLEKGSSEFDVQGMCGGGKYRLKEMVRNDAGQMVYSRQRTIAIGGDHFPPKLETPKQPEVASKEDGGNKTMNEIVTGQILTLIDRGQAMTQQQVEGITNLYKMMQEVKPASGDSEMMKLMVTMMGSLMTAMTTMMTQQRPEAPVTDPIAMVEKIGGVLKATAPSQTGMKENLEGLSQLLDIKIGMNEIANPPQNMDDKLMGFAQERIGQLLDIIQKSQDPAAKQAAAALPAGPPTTSQALPVNTPVGELKEAAQPKESPLLPWQQVLQYVRSRLIGYATQSKNASVMADYEFEQMTPPVRAIISEWISNDNAFAMAIEQIPELEQYGQWAGMFFGRLHENFYPDLYDEIEEGDTETVGLGLVPETEEIEKGVTNGDGSTDAPEE